MNFDFSDDQHAIKRTAKDLLAARFKLDHVRELAEAGEYDDDAWRELCELGWPGIFVPEEHGGQGLGTVELVILAEELGYALAPLPFLSNAAAGLMLQHAGSDEQRERWLPGVASGDALGTVGLARDGVAELVPDAGEAAFVILVEDGHATLQQGSEGAEQLDTIDSTRRFYRVPAAGGEELPGDPQPALDRIYTTLAAELAGVSQRALEMAVQYARDRKQFGRPIGSYQAVSHACAQMLLETENSRSTAYYAGWCADAEPESLPAGASMAKAYASDAGWNVTSSSLQVHGGIGFTWEHDLHFFLKRAKVDAVLYGSAREHRDRVAELSGLTRAAAAVG
jgi:alkylation response protein AidB-like acyl-CoA dehydrogenase